MSVAPLDHKLHEGKENVLDLQHLLLVWQKCRDSMNGEMHPLSDLFWESTCNDCYLSMQNCHDKSICCEDETGLCDWFEEIPEGDAE